MIYNSLHQAIENHASYHAEHARRLQPGMEIGHRDREHGRLRIM